MNSLPTDWKSSSSSVIQSQRISGLKGPVVGGIELATQSTDKESSQNQKPEPKLTPRFEFSALPSPEFHHLLTRTHFRGDYSCYLFIKRLKMKLN